MRLVLKSSVGEYSLVCVSVWGLAAISVLGRAAINCSLDTPTVAKIGWPLDALLLLRKGHGVCPLLFQHIIIFCQVFSFLLHNVLCGV